MTVRLADRLSAARQRRFVGRVAEIEVLQGALARPELPFCVLYIYGPGGVGKTTLLGEYVALSERAGVPALYLDARTIEPTPASFTAALRRALGVEPSTPLPGTFADNRRQLLLIDTYELLTPIDAWLRDELLPELPAHVLVVLAGRYPPAPEWRADPGWQSLVCTLALRNLSPEESRAYLTSRQVPTDQQRSMLEFTHGHPLALSLVADVFAQRAQAEFEPEAEPDVIKALLARLIQKVPGPSHRAALEACALVRVTTEALLAELLDPAEAHELFAWLRDLSFIEARAGGLFPHDLAREALAADLRWRNPDWYRELHRRARSYYTARLQQLTGQDQQRALVDLIYLHRDNRMLRAFVEWQDGNLLPDLARPDEYPLLAALVERHEGAQAAAYALHWFQRQPQGVLVIREVGHQHGRTPAGLLLQLALHQASPDDREADPSTRAAWHYLQATRPLRPGEGATLFRTWMARDQYQAVSPVQTLIFVLAVRHYLTTPGLAFSLFAVADPAFWAPAFGYADLTRLPEADFHVEGRHYGVYAHDWRSVPLNAWLAILAEREVAGEQPGSAPPAPAPLVVLSREEFASAVRAALQGYTRPDLLRQNALVRSRLVVERAGTAAERVATLQQLVRDAAEQLHGSPRDARAYRAVYHTYLAPAPTQERAAELLDLPFSTYRRHLKTGVTRIIEMLWALEISS